MTQTELREEVHDELTRMDTVVTELVHLHRDIGRAAPTLREKVAGGAFLMQFYNGTENVLKRLARFHSVSLPRSDKWHAELFEGFTADATPELSLLFDDSLADEMRAYRGFRHVVRSSYGVELDWERMREGIDRLPTTFERFQHAVLRHLDGL